jgi:hypothetical protein
MAYRRQKNTIHSLQVDGVVISDHVVMAEASFTHHDSLLGTTMDRKYSLDLDFLGTHSEDLFNLEVAFNEDEI